MDPVLSAESLLLRIPANLLEVSEELSADALRLILGYYLFMSAQEDEAYLCLSFDLRNSLPGFSDESAFERALEEVKRSGLIFGFSNPEIPEQTYLIPGTEQGESLLRSLEERPELLHDLKKAKVLPRPVRPNVYKLYEENIGPLTPYTAELLRDAAQTYSEKWLEEAIKEAIHYNARSWKYIQAILRNWKEKGRKRSNEEDKRDHESFRRLYLDQKRNTGK
ncbi:MAG: DnaD domain-containing protein [Anaerolineaceae bacterium]|jgi:DnaD/phage-associated family protein